MIYACPSAVQRFGNPPPPPFFLLYSFIGEATGIVFDLLYLIVESKYLPT